MQNSTNPRPEVDLGFKAPQQAQTRTRHRGQTSTTVPTISPAEKKHVLDEFLPKTILSVVPDHAISPDDDETVLQAAFRQTFMNKSSASLREMAQERSQKRFSAADRDFFIHLEEVFEIIRAIYCVIRLVSYGRAIQSIGENMTIKDPGLYSGYQKSPGGWAVYRNYCGVRGQANSVLGSMSKRLTPEEKAEYQKYVGVTREELEDVNNDDVLTEGNPTSQPADTTASRPNTNHHLLSLEPIDSEPNTAQHPVKVCAKPRSLEGTAKKFSKWLKKTELEVTQIAKSTQSHILVIGVSTKLDENSFQMIAGSPLALQFMKTHQQTYVEFDFPAQFQSFCTGVEVHDLRPATKIAISNRNGKRALAREALANLLNKHLPDGEEKAWPWVNCVAKLADWSLQIVFTEDAKTKFSVLSGGSSSLNDQNAVVIVDDLKHNRITLIKIPRDSSGLKKRAAKGTGPKTKKKQKVAF